MEFRCKDRGISQEDFPRLPGQSYGEELDQQIEQDLAIELQTYQIEKEVTVSMSNLRDIVKEDHKKLLAR